MNRFEGKVALVTGAARGIGRGIALKLASEGARVVVNDVTHMAEAEAVVAQIMDMGGDAFAFQADVSEPDSVAAMVEACVGRFGALDITAANVGISIREPVLEASWEHVRRTIEVSQFGVYHTCQLSAQQMTKQDLKQGSRGKIVITGSVHEEFPFKTGAAYNMAKAAINHFARTLAAELCERRINVNVVNPGWIDTPGERALFDDETIDSAGAKLPWGRMGRPEDIANTVAFLASHEADYITGAAIRVDGGLMVNLSVPG
jgi:glucose 1-dehydrogenase